MRNKKTSPPKSALQFLRWFCREDYIEEIEGDLTEIFEKHWETSPRKARMKFAWSVIRYFRPEFIKAFRSSHPVNPFIMIRHNFIIAYRNFFRYKASFLINVVGLSTGLACALLIYLWVNDEMHIDQFHDKGSRTYQVLKNTLQGDETIETLEYTPAMMAETMKEDLPELYLRDWFREVIRRFICPASSPR